MAQDVKFTGEPAASELHVPAIDHTYRLNEAVFAHAHLESGHKKGSSVVISLSGLGE